MYGFFPEMSESEVQKISVLGLAHTGDAVYELLIRSMLAQSGHTSVIEMHKLAVAMVKAQAQAKAITKIMPLLSAEETAVYKRGRNAKVNSVPHNASPGEYHAATGLEVLFGWLYLQGRIERVNELFNAITEE